MKPNSLIYASLTRLIGSTCKTINDIDFFLYFFSSFFVKVWFSVTLEKSKYRLPRVLGQKFVTTATVTHNIWQQILLLESVFNWKK